MDEQRRVFHNIYHGWRYDLEGQLVMLDRERI